MTIIAPLSTRRLNGVVGSCAADMRLNVVVIERPRSRQGEFVEPAAVQLAGPADAGRATPRRTGSDVFLTELAKSRTSTVGARRRGTGSTCRESWSSISARTNRRYEQKCSKCEQVER